MSEHDGFEGFKQRLTDADKNAYGEEIRQKYGKDVANAANARLMSMSAEQFSRMEALAGEILAVLGVALRQGDPAGEPAQKACALHKQWISGYWDHYSPQVHMSLVRMYVNDPRFSAYYDRAGAGAAVFLREACGYLPAFTTISVKLLPLFFKRFGSTGAVF